MEAPNQTETAQPTPEQLLKLLDLQLARERTRREKKSRNRASFLVAGILVIIVAAAVSLLVAQQLLAELRERGSMQPAPVELNENR
jgi:hypothetical protein